MKVEVIEKNLVTQVEYAYYEVEVPEEVAKLSEDEVNNWIHENYREFEAYHYEMGDVLEVYYQDMEIELPTDDTNV